MKHRFASMHRNVAHVLEVFWFRKGLQFMEGLNARSIFKHTERMKTQAQQAMVLLYAISAFYSAWSALNPEFSSLQSTHCLLISWFLSMGALAMYIIQEPVPSRIPHVSNK